MRSTYIVTMETLVFCIHRCIRPFSFLSLCLSHTYNMPLTWFISINSRPWCCFKNACLVAQIACCCWPDRPWGDHQLGAGASSRWHRDKLRAADAPVADATLGTQPHTHTVDDQPLFALFSSCMHH
jgi:hypothetical protein